MKDCVLWDKARGRHGYGVVGVKDGSRWKTMLVHRLVCRFFHGDPPPGKNEVMHSCDTRACYEPSHLSWGSHADNMADARRKGRTFLIPPRRGEEHPQAKLTDALVIEIRRCLEAGQAQVDVARRFGISQPSVSSIKRRAHWRHLQDNR